MTPHVFCTDEQLEAECIRINDLILTTYADFGFDEIVVKLSTRPEKRVGADALWTAPRASWARCWRRSPASPAAASRPPSTRARGAFYGPKFEYVLRDAIGRDWQCGTTQVDFNLPERFGAFYIGADGDKIPPVMVHRAICGSMERFIGILIENYAGAFPFWFAPKQVMVCPITSEADDYAVEVLSALKKAGLKADADLRNEKISYKVREHSLQKIPVILAVGKKEAAERTVSSAASAARRRRSWASTRWWPSSPTRRPRPTYAGRGRRAEGGRQPQALPCGATDTSPRRERSAAGRERGAEPVLVEGSPLPPRCRSSTSPRRGEVRVRFARIAG